MMTLKEVAKVLKNHINIDDTITHITTDSREVKDGSLFFAIVGENIDGHRFVNSAFERGAVACVVSEQGDYSQPDRIITVPETRFAHITLGGYYLSKFSVKKVAVTGSVGKTTTKEFIYSVLASKFKTHKNHGNLNNDIGLPKTMFEMDDSIEAAVLEMGMSSFGEIERLSLAVKPDIAVITNIGVSHIELLGSQDNILKAKLEILDGMKHGSPLILNGDDVKLTELLQGKITEENFSADNYRLYTYGVDNKNCDVTADNICYGNKSTAFDIVTKDGTYKADIPTVGKHNVQNALAAFLVGVIMGMKPQEAVKALVNYAPAGMRQRVTEFKGGTVVEDCYNSAPDSLKAAADTLSDMKTGGKKVMVLSDMRELGNMAEAVHRECGQYIAEKGIDMILVTGKYSVYFVEGAKVGGLEQIYLYDSKESLAKGVLEKFRAGDIFWFKASRGVELEDVLHMIYETKE